MNIIKEHMLVVGGSSGIGRAAVQRFFPLFNVSVMARRANHLAELESLGVKTFAVDVTDSDALSRSLDDVIDQNGKIDAMIYCAGMQLIKPLRNLKSADICSLLGVNLVAPMLFVSAMASNRISSHDAVFCAITSVAGQRPEPGIVAYSAAKAGIEALIKGAAKELGPRRFVGVAPGWLDTEMTQAYGHIYSEKFQADLERRSPAGMATIDSIVDTIEFLISDRACHITGEVITVDGGAIL